jgi:hypothetical protein
MSKYDDDISFIRVGGLSPVKQLGYDKSMPTFHCPPARHGIYAFIYPYYDTFMLYGDESDVQWKEHNTVCNRWAQLKAEGFRKFKHRGNLWCHFVDTVPRQFVMKEKGTWVLTDMYGFKEGLKRIMHIDRTDLMHDQYLRIGGKVIDPYKRGLNGFMGKDHLEVFIERVK